jgi:hypothetical protein
MLRALVKPSAVAFLCILISGAAFAQKDKDDKKLPKLSADEIVAKHVGSIGPKDKIAAVRTRILTGVGTLTSKIDYAGKMGGPAQFASSGDKLVLAVVFNANDYPFEKVGYDGKDLSTGNFPGGVSPLANFLKSNKFIVKRGLFGGALSTAWPLLDGSKDVRLESAGAVKIGDQTPYKLKLTTSGSGDMSISLYFEPDTFRHVRTEYYYRTGELMSPNPNRPVMLGSGPQDYMVTEEFSNFGQVEGLTLPLTYVIRYETKGGSKSLIWTINFDKAFVNQDLEDTVFRVS